MADYPERWLEDIEALFNETGADVERVGDTFNLERGRGNAARKANVDPVPLLADLSSGDEAANRRAMAAWTQGVRFALLEPATSDGADWEFERAAGQIYPVVVPGEFVEGARAVGDAPWQSDFVEDLRFVYAIELDFGIRLLSESQFEGWGVTADRVRSAARSMLFHETRRHQPSSLEDDTPVERFNVGDSYDAARIIILEDLLFGEFDETSRVAIPSSDELLFVRQGGGEAGEALREAAEERRFEGEIPLTDTLFRFERGNVVPE